MGATDRRLIVVPGTPRSHVHLLPGFSDVNSQNPATYREAFDIHLNLDVADLSSRLIWLRGLNHRCKSSAHLLVYSFIYPASYCSCLRMGIGPKDNGDREMRTVLVPVQPELGT